MSNYKKEIEILVDLLDKSANANTAWLQFELNAAAAFDLHAFILAQLKSGHFHFALVKSDIIRGLENYVCLSYPKHPKHDIIRLLYPGTTWNGTTELKIESIATDLAKELIIDLLTGAGKHFSKSPLGKQLNKIEAERIVQDFIECLKLNNSQELTFFQITPDFLWTAEESLSSDHDHPILGYFENDGRDLALGILINGKDSDTLELNILLTNGYS